MLSTIYLNLHFKAFAPVRVRGAFHSSTFWFSIYERVSSTEQSGPFINVSQVHEWKDSQKDRLPGLPYRPRPQWPLVTWTQWRTQTSEAKAGQGHTAPCYRGGVIASAAVPIKRPSWLSPTPHPSKTPNSGGCCLPGSPASSLQLSTREVRAASTINKLDTDIAKRGALKSRAQKIYIKAHRGNLIMRKYQTNPNWGTFLKRAAGAL